ncbi:tRNA uridine-5-carboxymethylaminomethyl(34) synthesis GTPase MnmE [bacterium]|nr:tRNA uridine-5-carboxymethylaminomethyl(34) synthesis GTPase MnmE [bacterium]
MKNDNTICAISSPLGSGAISVIRLSGPSCKRILEEHLKNSSVKSRRMYTSHFIINSSKFDRVNYCYYKGPETYTGEDLLEIFCHGGIGVQGGIINALENSGIRPALPGEFTLRAIRNGKMDLIEAEAVNALITSRTRNVVPYLNKHLNGSLTERFTGLQDKYAKIKALFEASIDFSDSDSISPDILAQGMDSLNRLAGELKELVDSFHLGAILTAGFHIAIVGKPNVGKSSLLNMVLKKERSIVTEYAGTTRDILKEEVSIGGYDVCLYDTAGIRKTEDHIEKLGIKKVDELMNDAHLIIFIMDLSMPPDSEDMEIARLLSERKKQVLVFFNKMDKGQIDGHEKVAESSGALTAFEGSITNEDGLDDLLGHIKEKLDTMISHAPENMIFSSRQRWILRQVSERNAEILGKDVIKETDISSYILEEILELLEELTGFGKSFDLQGYIFDNFCIGK